MKGCMPDALATGASAMVISGAAACQRTTKLIAKQSRANAVTNKGRRQQAASVGGDQIRHPVIDAGVSEHGSKADEDPEQQRKVPIDST